MQLLTTLLGKKATIRKIDLLANQIRKDIVTMVTTAKSGHPAGALGLADIFATLYTAILTHKPTQPNWKDRDRVILSNGHTCPVLYATLARMGYFPVEQLKTFRLLGSPLQGHPHRESLPGVENTSGPLGLGLSQAVGCALGLAAQKKSAKVFCILSDAEHQEGQTWEAYLYAGAKKLNNLVAIIDCNKIQIGGYTNQIIDIEPLAAKLTAFGWKVVEVAGNTVAELYPALSMAKKRQQKPLVYICHTTPGKGVSFMENKPEWHGKPPSEEQLSLALAELSKIESTQLV